MARKLMEDAVKAHGDIKKENETLRKTTHDLET